MKNGSELNELTIILSTQMEICSGLNELTLILSTQMKSSSELNELTLISSTQIEIYVERVFPSRRTSLQRVLIKFYTQQKRS
ncbi:MAG: hypothetical protein ABS911_03115 [Carnobacterium sp.]